MFPHFGVYSVIQQARFSRLYTVHSTPYTIKLPQKSDCSCSIQNNSLPLHRKPKVCRHIKKRLLALVLALWNLETFASPKQEGSKRPLGYDYPAAERPCVDCSVWWHFIFGVGVACLFLLAGYSKTSEWRISKGKVPRFLYAYMWTDTINTLARNQLEQILMYDRKTIKSICSYIS